MAQHEKYHFRDASYSAWHRTESISRFISKVDAAKLSLIDIDTIIWVECNEKRLPVALIETAIDNGQQKCYQMLMNLSILSGLPALVVLYKLEDFSSNPADPRYRDISSFRLKRIHPKEEQEWRILTPQEYAQMLVTMRTWSFDNFYTGDALWDGIFPNVVSGWGYDPSLRFIKKLTPNCAFFTAIRDVLNSNN